MDAGTEAAHAAAVERALGSLDLERQVRLLTGSDYWTTAAEERIGLRAMVLTDGPAGVRGQEWDERSPSVSLPSPTACAATWDEALVTRLAGVLAAEARRKGVDVVLGPTMNLQRSPLAGRHFEYLSEDPLLSGRIGLAYVVGLQAHGVAATAKHYVCNDAETNRFSVDVQVDERTLREVYLAPFEALVVQGGVWVVMAAYNQVNGVTMTESPLLRSPLLTGWGFDGVVVSDWYAARSTEASARGGLGLVMPGPRGPWGEALVAAVRGGRVAAAAVEDKARRLLRLAARVGALAGTAAEAVPAAGELSDVGVLLREAAAAGMVLVRNHGAALPLDPASLRLLAVLGPNAAEGVSQGSGTAEVVAASEVAPLDGLRNALGEGVEVLHAAGARTRHGLAPMPGRLVTCPHCGEAGLRARYLDAAGRELRAEHRAGGLFVWYGAQILRGATVEVSTRFRADASGEWQIGFAGVGAFQLEVDGHSAIDETIRPGTDSFFHNFLKPPQRAVTRFLEEGQELDLVLRHQLAPAEDLAKVTLGMVPPGRSDDEELADAVRLAGRADAAVVVVGSEVESEGLDRVSLGLPGRQDALVRAVAAANPRTIVVVNAAGPVAMPWRDEVAAVLVAWLPGQEFGHALADVLLGAAEPGGRLPMTWGARDEDVPVLSTMPIDDALPYTEGLHVGYRAWLRAGTLPAYPFGHGLGYTTWVYLGIEAPATVRAEDGVTVRVQLRNTGRRRGKEVVQAYLSRPESAVERPALWLAGFRVVEAEPGEVAVVELRLEARAFQHWSVEDQAWRTEPGTFLLSAGRSVSDRPLRQKIEVEP